MIFITTLLKKKLMLNYDLLTQPVLLREENQKMFMKNFLRGKICLILVTIQRIQSFLMRQIKKLLAKRKMNLKELL